MGIQQKCENDRSEAAHGRGHMRGYDNAVCHVLCVIPLEHAQPEWLEPAFLICFLLVGFGGIIDWIREPTVRRKT